MDYVTKKHNMDVARNSRLNAVRNLNDAIAELLNISTNEEVINTPPAKAVANVGGQLVILKIILKNIEL